MTNRRHNSKHITREAEKPNRPGESGDFVVSPLFVEPWFESSAGDWSQVVSVRDGYGVAISLGACVVVSDRSDRA